MCGIVGMLCARGSGDRVMADRLMAMRDAMAHRGPDGAGLWISEDGLIGLGHRRLSIIDLSESAGQPMCNEDDSLWVTYNGEIYNHMDIRRELETIGGHRWKTDHSDTEVILHAFEQWGIACVERFRGMFAIAIWDARTRSLWLVRDRIGIKPIYYSSHHGRFLFASEIKALLKDPEQRPAVDEESLFHYLSFLATPAPCTMFAGIRKVFPATWLKIDESGSIEERRYWDVWDRSAASSRRSEDDVAVELMAELRRAVMLHKMGDVPVGVFLSGGIDSSTNALLFSEGEQRPVKTFSIGYKGGYASYENENHHARRIAKMVGAEYHERLLTVDDLMAFLPEMIRLQDEPIADAVCVPMYYVSKLARDNGMVACHAGEGADELFCGYPGWRTMLQLQRCDDLPVPRSAKRLAVVGLRLMGKGYDSSYEWLQRGIRGQPIFWGGVEAFTEPHKRRLLSARLRKTFAGLSSWDVIQPIRQRFEERAHDASHMNWMSYLDLNIRLPELLLMRLDKMSMGVSLEGRAPFLDHVFVELAMGIPGAMKTRNGKLKYILKKAVRGLVPDDIIDRGKQGFGIPIHEWFVERLKKECEVVFEEFCERTDFFDRDEVMKLMVGRNKSQAWCVLNFALWMKEYIGY